MLNLEESLQLLSEDGIHGFRIIKFINNDHQSGELFYYDYYVQVKANVIDLTSPYGSGWCYLDWEYDTTPGDYYAVFDNHVDATIWAIKRIELILSDNKEK